MTFKNPAVTPEYVREILDFDPDTGRFVWKRRKVRPNTAETKFNDENWNVRFAGKLVAKRRQRNGHLQINIHCHNYAAHRIAWMHFYGLEPHGDIDHKNGVPSDNRIENLRIATVSQNLMNSKIRTDNSSGVKGVSWTTRDRKWYAYINKDGRMKSLGRYKEFADAVAARRRAEPIYHGEFARAS